MDLQLGLFNDQPLTGEYAIPPGAQVTCCRSCDAQVVWARTDAGKAIPLSLDAARSINGVRYALTHFSDCPHSSDWRKA
jgi:hypothetical protein